MQLNCGNIHEQCAISPPRVLREIQDDLRSAGVVPTLNPTTGALLRTLAVSHPSGVFLQLGVGSCELVAWIADGMDITSRLVTVVVDPTLRNILKHHLGDDIRMAFHNQNELEFLIDVHRHRFHLIVIDCVLAGVRLVRAASETVAAGGLLVITDIVADGAECPEAREAISFLQGLEDFRTVSLPEPTNVLVSARCPMTHKPVRKGGRQARRSVPPKRS